MLVFSGGEAWGKRRHLNHELAARSMPPSPNLPRPTGQSCSAAAVLLLLILMLGVVWRPHIQGAEEPQWLGKGIVRTGRKACRWLNPFHSTIAPMPSMQICSAAGYRKALQGAAAQPPPHHSASLWVLDTYRLYPLTPLSSGMVTLCPCPT